VFPVHLKDPWAGLGFCRAASQRCGLERPQGQLRAHPCHLSWLGLGYTRVSTVRSVGTAALRTPTVLRAWDDNQVAWVCSPCELTPVSPQPCHLTPPEPSGKVSSAARSAQLPTLAPAQLPRTAVAALSPIPILCLARSSSSPIPAPTAPSYSQQPPRPHRSLPATGP